MEKIFIDYLKEEDYIPNLWDILNCIENPLNYKWKIIELWGSNHKINLIDIFKEIESNEGYLIDFHELIDFAKTFDQIIEISVIGYTKENIDIRDYNTLSDKVDFNINLIDGNFWEITSKNEIFLEEVKRKFHHEVEYK